MKYVEDPRMRVSRRIFALSWLYYGAYACLVMVASYTLGTEPYLWGLPRWVAIGNLFIPVAFVLILIPLIEKVIPDVSLTDDKKPGEAEE